MPQYAHKKVEWQVTATTHSTELNTLKHRRFEQQQER